MLNKKQVEGEGPNWKKCNMKKLQHENGVTVGDMQKKKGATWKEPNTKKGATQKSATLKKVQHEKSLKKV